jgi:hypothetical protein
MEIKQANIAIMLWIEQAGRPYRGDAPIAQVFRQAL